MGQEANSGPSGTRGILWVERAALRAVYGLFTFLLGPPTLHNFYALLRTVLVILGICWLLVQPFYIPSESMYPTLNGDPRFFHADRIAVNKWVYGPRVPFMNKRLFRLQEPRRWDIIVFNAVNPEGGQKRLIKRVVGLPGEQVHIQDGKVYINGVAAEPPEELRDILRYTGKETPDPGEVYEYLLDIIRTDVPPPFLNPENPGVQKMFEDLQGVRDRIATLRSSPGDPREIKALFAGFPQGSYDIVQEAIQIENAYIREFKYGILPGEEFTHVPEDHYFVLGDNSAHSRDGRVFGWVPNNHILGRAFCIFWPIGRWRDLTGFSRTWWGRLLLFGLPAALVLYELVHAFFLGSWRIPSNVAAGKLARGEHIYVNRVAFGLRLPFLGHKRPFGREPRRGEIVVYRSPQGTPHPDALLLGRVIGLPGERLSLEGGTLHVDGHPVDNAEIVLPVRAAGAAESDFLARLAQDGYALVPREHVILRNETSDAQDDSLMCVERDQLLGAVLGVWWPVWRARRIRF